MSRPFLIFLALIVAFFIGQSVYVIDQAEQGIVVQFGEPVGEVVTEPGLHWKLPFIQNVRRFDKRILPWDGDVSQVPTLGREFILVDATARWRIADPLKFLRSVRDETGARTRLDDIIDSVVRDIISGTDLEEIVRSADWAVDVKLLDEEGVAREDVDLEKPKKGRGRLEQEIRLAASKQMPELGIELVDVRLKRINYIDSVRAQVENRMVSERQSIAARFRSEVRVAARKSSARCSANCAPSVPRPSARPPRSAARPTPKRPGSTVNPTAPIRSSMPSCARWRVTRPWVRTPR